METYINVLILREVGDYMKGQGSTEYLVVFAAVLIVALIVVYVLNSFGQIGQSTARTSSEVSWQNERPVGITKWDPVGPNVTFRFKNNGARKIYIKNITLDTEAPTSALNLKLTSGSEKEQTVTFGNDICSSTESGETKEYDVKIKYTVGSGTHEYTEVGSVPMKIICP